MLRTGLAWAAACAVGALFLISPAPARAAWLKAETEHFVIYSEGERQALRDYAVKLEDFDAVLRHKHGVPADAPAGRKLPIYMVDGDAGLRAIEPRMGGGVAGFYSSDLEDVYAVVIRGGNWRDRDYVLFHEYVHHFMLQNFANAYPAWVVEGWAEYFMTTEIDDERIQIGAPNTWRSGMLISDPISLEDLISKAPFESGHSAQFYAQAWFLTHYMLSDPERERQLNAYLKAVAAGEPSVQAMEAATGMSLSALRGELRRYMRGKLPSAYLPRARLVKRAVTISELPASADDVLLLDQRVKSLAAARHDKNPEHAPDAVDRMLEAQALKRARAAAERYGGDRLASLVLARAETNLGDRAAGEAALQRLLQADPNDAEALRLMGISRMDAADALAEENPQEAARLLADARAYLVRSDKADPNSYQTLLAYARTRSGEPGYPNENTLNVLLVAHALAPQVAAVSLQAAHGLMIGGRYDDARAVLSPVANDPHNEFMAKTARELLAKIDARASGKPEAAE